MTGVGAWRAGVECRGRGQRGGESGDGGRLPPSLEHSLPSASIRSGEEKEATLRLRRSRGQRRRARESAVPTTTGRPRFWPAFSCLTNPRQNRSTRGLLQSSTSNLSPPSEALGPRSKQNIYNPLKEHQGAMAGETESRDNESFGTAADRSPDAGAGGVPVRSQSKETDLSRVEIAAFSVGHVLNDLCAACWFTYLLVFLQSAVGLSHSAAGVVMFVGQASGTRVGSHSDITENAASLTESHLCRAPTPPLRLRADCSRTPLTVSHRSGWVAERRTTFSGRSSS